MRTIGDMIFICGAAAYGLQMVLGLMHKETGAEVEKPDSPGFTQADEPGLVPGSLPEGQANGWQEHRTPPPRPFSFRLFGSAVLRAKP